MFSIVTNVCPIDGARIRKTLPHWLRVFGSSLIQVLVVVDRKPPEGRIANLHASETNEEEDIDNTLAQLQKLDQRVIACDLDYSRLADISKYWFKNGAPIRCQAGTPIFAFIYALQLAESQYVLKLDCDMLFCNNGFPDQAIASLQGERLALVEPARLYHTEDEKFSTRAYLLDIDALKRHLPINAHKLDYLRRIHRRIQAKPDYLALEQMLQKEIALGALSKIVLPQDCGFSMHVPRREQFLEDNIDSVIRRVELGQVPIGQLVTSWDYSREHWAD